VNTDSGCEPFRGVVSNTYRDTKTQLLRALNLREKLLGPEHPAVANVLHNLAILDSVEKRYVEADARYRRALDIMEKSLGPSHPHLAQTLAGYAWVLQKTKRKSQAAAMKARAQEILAKNPAARAAHQTVDVRDLDRSKKAWRE
jgi:tetratricopeptide (TPR) repeat protein